MKKIILFILITFCVQNISYSKNYIFFEHNYFLELYPLSASHPEYGNCEYNEIIKRFKKDGFEVISEIRAKNTNSIEYAKKVSKQIDSLIKRGVKPNNITVVGTSRGGYIAQYVSTFQKNRNMNFVFIGCCSDNDVINNDDIKYFGNILSIYEKSDTLGQSCQKMKLKSGESVNKFKEIELNTGSKHGYLYKALDSWIDPTIMWSNHNYDLTNDSKNTDISFKIDSLLNSKSDKPFNGIVLIADEKGTEYVKCKGYADIFDKTKRIPINLSSQFIIGSISKQITAAIVLLEYEKGHLKLDQPIRKYLPNLSQKWADTVTVRHLLTHMHGISSFNKPTNFKVGSQFDYNLSDHGYNLLSQIVEKTSGKSFLEISDQLFKKLGMINTFHPDNKSYKNLVDGFSPLDDGTLVLEVNSFENSPAAGGFISTASDLAIWNQALHSGKVLKSRTYKMMMTKQKNAIRNHPIFGKTEYGLGPTIDTKDNLIQIGQTGFAPGFVSMNFYFPKSKTSVIVLENIVYISKELKDKFYYHVEILKVLRENLKNEQ